MPTIFPQIEPLNQIPRENVIIISRYLAVCHGTKGVAGGSALVFAEVIYFYQTRVFVRDGKGLDTLLNFVIRRAAAVNKRARRDDAEDEGRR